MNKEVSFYPNIKNEKLHIGFIPDGGRRWADKLGLSVEEGYQNASFYIFDFIKLCFREGAGIVSIYGASSHNFKRDPKTVLAFCEAYDSLIINQLSKYLDENNISLSVIGDKNLIPSFLLGTIDKIETNYKDYSEKKIYFLIGYDPIKELISSIESADTPSNFINYLWVKEPVDLVIRTGGANILSDFLPLQSAYARIYFFEEIFPNIKPENYIEIIRSYRELRRLYGE